LAQTYSSISRATQDLGVSSEQTLRLTETLAKAITISGVSAQSANAAMIQLSQGLSSGTLRGEELNSIMEQTPRVARALAQGLGVGIGALREMGKEGKLTPRSRPAGR
jgi:tape measure domain-containing protein